MIVKRVIGLPNDIIEYKNNVLYVNNVQVDEEYITDDVSTGTLGKILLGENEYLILGDHRSGSQINGSYKPGSYDGRDFGPINENNIIGIVKYKMNSLFDWEKVK